MLRSAPMAVAALGAALAAIVLAGGARTATAAEPCWRAVINDWYDNGQIDSRYPVHCYREALQHAPGDLKIYSDLPEKVEHALQSALRTPASAGKAQRSTGAGSGATTVSPSDKAPKSSAAGKDGGAPAKGAGGGASKSNSKPRGPIAHVLNQLGPSRADSLPIPLLVLAGVGLLLIAAGTASIVMRRLQRKRVRSDRDA